MNLQELKRENEIAERKCRRELLWFSVLCLFVFLVVPIGIVLSVNYADDIDRFFDFKTQVLTFLVLTLAGSIIYLIRWWRRF